MARLYAHNQSMNGRRPYSALCQSNHASFPPKKLFISRVRQSCAINSSSYQLPYAPSPGSSSLTAQPKYSPSTTNLPNSSRFPIAISTTLPTTALMSYAHTSPVYYITAMPGMTARILHMCIQPLPRWQTQSQPAGKPRWSALSGGLEYRCRCLR